eukprot:10291742-Karenia_brevis.AAC.1
MGDDSVLPEQALAQSRLPCRLSGLGLRSALRTSAPPYWSSWADVLPTICRRFPAFEQHVARSLVEGRVQHVQCLSELETCRTQLTEFLPELPAWQAVLQGARPPAAEHPEGDEDVRDPGEWAHGWQYFTTDAAERRVFDELL